MKMRPRVLVIGGGISGLTCCHELSDFFEVHLVERARNLGGQSRSELHNGTHVCYSWRIFTTRYFNLLHMFSRIPHPDGGSVKDQFQSAKTYRSLTSGSSKMRIGWISLGDIDDQVSDAELADMKNKFITLACMSYVRLRGLDHITFFDYMNPKSSGARAFLDHLVAPLLGLEARQASVFSVVFMLQSVYGHSKGLLLKAPFEKAIFNPWKTHLERKGVRMHLGRTVRQVTKDGVVMDNNEALHADYIVLCVDQDALVSITRDSPVKLTQIERFADMTRQVYYSFDICFSKQILLKTSIFTASELPWLPIVERWNKYWSQKDLRGAAEQWNVALLDNATYRGRSISQCSPSEIVAFTIEQLKRAQILHDVKHEDGAPMWEQPFRIRMWPHWAFDKTLKNTENQYKLSWNAGAFSIAPTMRTNLDNVFIGSVVMKNRPVVSQEMACLNGRTVASHIRLRHMLPPLLLYPQTMAHRDIFMIPRIVDRWLLHMGRPSIRYRIYSERKKKVPFEDVSSLIRWLFRISS